MNGCMIKAWNASILKSRRSRAFGMAARRETVIHIGRPMLRVDERRGGSCQSSSTDPYLTR